MPPALPIAGQAGPRRPVTSPSLPGRAPAPETPALRPSRARPESNPGGLAGAADPTGGAGSFAHILAAQLTHGGPGGPSDLGGAPGQLALPAAGAVRAGLASDKGTRAIAWARSHLGQQDWNGLCERFVEEAYGTSGVYPSAAAAQELMTHRGQLAWRTAPPGALLYFAPDATNDFNGHVGIALGGGRMISAASTGVREDRLDAPYWAERFVGWGEPGRLADRTPGASLIKRPSRPAGSAALFPAIPLGVSTASPTTTSRPRSPVAAPVPWQGLAALHVPKRS